MLTIPISTSTIAQLLMWTISVSETRGTTKAFLSLMSKSHRFRVKELKVVMGLLRYLLCSTEGGWRVVTRVRKITLIELNDMLITSRALFTSAIYIEYYIIH